MFTNAPRYCGPEGWGTQKNAWSETKILSLVYLSSVSSASSAFCIVVPRIPSISCIARWKTANKTYSKNRHFIETNNRVQFDNFCFTSINFFKSLKNCKNSLFPSKYFADIKSKCQTIWISDEAQRLWIQIVCKGHQRSTKSTASGQKVVLDRQCSAHKALIHTRNPLHVWL